MEYSMLFDNFVTFNKDNLDLYLKELAKEYRKINGTKMPAEIILVGGAAVLANYGFRDMTMDIDAIIRASSAMKEAINNIGDKCNLPNGWLNSDFTKTSSYSSKLVQYSMYYKKFANILEVRTISAEYLVAMKLKSGRKYKNDRSDVIGILAHHKSKNEPLTKEKITVAVNNLYGGWDCFSQEDIEFINYALESNNSDILYKETLTDEAKTKEQLVRFENPYPDTVNKNNISDIINQLKNKKDKT